jgi:hypothetical protein
MIFAKYAIPSLLFSAILLSTSLSFSIVVQYGYSQTAEGNNHDISIMSSSSYMAKNEDGENDYHVVGEVKNNSTIDTVNNVSISSTFYDNAAKIVETDFAYTYIDVLRPAEKSSFEIILNDAAQSQKVSSYKLSASGDKDKAKALPALLRLSVDNNYLDNMSEFHVVGKVTNQGSQKATFVRVSGAFYNSSNTVVAAGITYVSHIDLESGHTAPFEIRVNAPSTKEITSASLNVCSQQYSSVIKNER